MSTGTGLKSRPYDALRTIVDSPNWVGNLLWLTLGALASGVFVGQIALFGYGAELIEKKAGRPDSPGVDVDPERIGDYLSKGIWPFVVHFVLQLVLGFVAMIPIVIVVFGAIAVGVAAFGEAGPPIGMILAMPIIMFISAAIAVVSVPFLILAMIKQDFSESFDIAWVKGFLRIMFKEVLVSGFVFWLLAMLVCIAGMLVFCVGYIVSIGIIWGGMMHMLAQWYEIYLDRGGEPVTPPSGGIVDATLV